MIYAQELHEKRPGLSRASFDGIMRRMFLEYIVDGLNSNPFDGFGYVDESTNVTEYEEMPKRGGIAKYL